MLESLVDVTAFRQRRGRTLNKETKPQRTMEEVLAAIRKTFTEEKNSPDAEPETPPSDAGSGTGADPSS